VHGAYTGQEALTFSQYIDTATGKTLHAVPGGVYDITPASGHEVPEIPVPWFEWVEDDGEWEKMLAAFEGARVAADEPPKDEHAEDEDSETGTDEG
jgi:hypothetical protein